MVRHDPTDSGRADDIVPSAPADRRATGDLAVTPPLHAISAQLSGEARVTLTASQGAAVAIIWISANAIIAIFGKDSIAIAAIVSLNIGGLLAVLAAGLRARSRKER